MGARTLISQGAHTPRWAGATHELFFIKGDELMAARSASRGESFEVEPPRALFKTPSASFDVSADGRRFLFFLPLAGQAMSDEIHVRLDGFEELRNPTGNRE